jgi:hypothetical protein
LASLFQSTVKFSEELLRNNQLRGIIDKCLLHWFPP